MSDPTTPDRPTPATGAVADSAGKPAEETATAEEKPAAGASGVEDTLELAKVEDAASNGKPAADATAAAGKPAEGKTADPKPADSKTADSQTADGKAAEGKTAETTAADGKAAGATAAEGKAAGAKGAGGKKSRLRGLKRGPWLTVGGAVVVLLVLAVLGYVWGLGPMNRLNTARGITPPGQLAGLDRITDQEIRNQLQLDQTREALSRINDGKQATVEAYGNLDGDRMFVVIALRGKVDIDKTVADSGATPEKIKKVGRATCVESSGNLPTQCYRGSNTLTVIAQSANEDVTVDAVAPVAEEAFNAMK
ncbi:hypothetical protein [Kribbella sp. NPDC050470]|uniref:hypothetical protein n=1 Tax=unclassified Kribbella TaxID=2644121 RepID=UPI00378CF8EC